MTISGTLLSRGCTTGWKEWVHGDLWLFPDGILRVPLGWVKSLTFIGFVYVHQPLRKQMFDIVDYTRLTLQPTNLWLPAITVSKASLGHSLGADELRIGLLDGTLKQLLWLPHPDAYSVLEDALREWHLLERSL